MSSAAHKKAAKDEDRKHDVIRSINSIVFANCQHNTVTILTPLLRGWEPGRCLSREFFLMVTGKGRTYALGNEPFFNTN